MRHFVLFISLVLGLPAAAAELQFNFGELGANGSLTNFHADLLGEGKPPVWKILPGQAPSAFSTLADPSKNAGGGGSVLAQTSQDPTDEHFPLYIYDGDKFRNFRFATQFKIVSGIAEQMAGLVFRFQNTSNFYIVRYSALGKNLRFYKVVDGARSEPVGVACDLPLNTWHQLAVQCDGNQIAIALDGKAMPTLGDNTFIEGKIGFWTKSDSVTYFDNATVNYTPVIPAAQAMVDSVVRQQPRLLGLQVYVLGTNNSTSILASKDPSDIGQPGTEAELTAIHDGTAFYGRESGAALVTLPLHDRNGEVIAAVRLKMKSFLGETQDNAVGRALLIMKLIQEFGMSADDLNK